MLCLASCVEVVLLEKGVVYSRFVLPKFSVEVSLCGKSCVDYIVKILLCEGEDVELCARTSKYILVFVFDPLSLTLSLIYLALIYIVISFIYAWFVCVCPYLCSTKGASYSTSTLI